MAALGGGLWTVVLGDWDRGEDGDSETLEMLVEEVRLLGVEYCDTARSAQREPPQTCA